MTFFHSRVRSSKIQAVKQGEDCSPESTPRLNRWLTPPAGGTARYWHQPNRIKYTRAGFRGFNPNRSGGNSLQRSIQVWRLPGGQHRRRRGRSAIRSGGLRNPPPSAAVSGAAHRGPRARGAEGGPPAPPRRLRGLVAGSRPRPAERLPARLGPSRCPVSGRVPPAAHSPPPSARSQDRVGQAPRRARTPLSAPAPHTQPNGFPGACPGAGAGGWNGTRTPRSPPPFPKGAPALSPPSHAALRRRKAATPAPLLRVPDRSRSTSAAEPALGAAAAASALTVGVVSRQ